MCVCILCVILCVCAYIYNGSDAYAWALCKMRHLFEFRLISASSQHTIAPIMSCCSFSTPFTDAGKKLSKFLTLTISQFGLKILILAPALVHIQGAWITRKKQWWESESSRATLICHTLSQQIAWTSVKRKLQ